MNLYRYNADESRAEYENHCDSEGDYNFELSKSLMIDNGSDMIKVGHVGDDVPRAVFPNTTGILKRDIPRNPGFIASEGIWRSQSQEVFVGDEARNRRGNSLKFFSPISSDGSPQNWYHLEKIYHHCFCNEMRVDSEEYSVIMSSFHPMKDVDFEKISKIMFETFEIVSLCISDSSVFSLIESGNTTGAVLESGNGITRSVCIEETIPIQNSLVSVEDMDPYLSDDIPQTISQTRKKVSGELITDCLIHLLNGRDFFSTNSRNSLSVQKVIARDVKEKLCYVAYDFNEELTKSESFETYELPDGSSLVVGSERFRAPEILFNPTLFPLGGYENLTGIHEMLQSSILKSSTVRKDEKLKDILYQNIILSGGSTLFEGFVERLTKEMQSLVDRNTRVKVRAPAERKYSTWIGGSIMGISRKFRDQWVKKEEYQEHGGLGGRLLKQRCHLAICENPEGGNMFRYFSRKDVDLEERLQFVVNRFASGDEFTKMVIRTLNGDLKTKTRLD